MSKKEEKRQATIGKPTLTFPDMLDAEKHKQDLIDQREKRNMAYNEPTVAKSTEVYVPSKDSTNGDGMKKTGKEALPSDIKGDEYPFTEAKKQLEKKAGKPWQGVVEEINEPY
jgi:hypothetical protein